jgi:hypothetical protein
MEPLSTTISANIAAANLVEEIGVVTVPGENHKPTAILSLTNFIT